MYKVKLTLTFLILSIAISFSNSKEFDKFKGFFNFSYDESKDKIFLEVDKLDYEFLYIGSLASGVGSNDIGLDRGQLGQEKLVKFVKKGNKILLVEPNLFYRAQTQNISEKKSVEQAFNEINTNDIIDKGSDVFKHYLKKNVNKNNVNKGILYYNLDINLEDIINNNENQIDVNIEFLRKYSNLRIIINDNNFKKTYEFDLKQDKFYLVFQNNTYLFELNYNFPDNIKRKYQSEHLFLEYYVN